MMQGQLVITINGAAQGSDDWIHLEQEGTPKSQNNVSLATVVQMVNRAFAGLSARTLQPDLCPAASIDATGTLTATLYVYVWPSAMDLEYSLAAAGAVVGLPELVRVEREVDVAVMGSAAVQLPWLVEGATDKWQLGCYNARSEEIPPPQVTISGATITVSEACYGVLRVKGVATGYRYPVVCSFAKATVGPQKGEYAWQSVADVDISVTATWYDADGEQSEILKLIMPDCVIDLLALCQGDVPKIFGAFHNDEYGKTFRIYYNACTGEPMWWGWENDDKK